MSTATLQLIPTRRRDRLFAEIKRIVGEAEAIDRALEPIGEALAQDEALEEIVDLLDAELSAAQRKSHRLKPAAA
ncbi:MAG: hypothetical protein HS116_05785 [Planctomycetes bacterium]|nr:hypothetical protein [Planctomycetota bacterium]